MFSSISSFSGTFKAGKRPRRKIPTVSLPAYPSPALDLDALDYSGSGSTWQSSIGPDADLVNAPTYVAASPTYFDFNGSTQHAALLHNSILKPTAAITMEQWVAADDWTAGTAPNFKTALSCTQSGGYSHFIQDGTWKSYVRIGASYQIPTADVSGFAAGSWHHAVTTFDGQFTKLYIDGVLVDTEDLGTSGNVIGYDPDNSILIGAEASGGTTPSSNYWDGKIGLTRIWSSALDQTQVTAIYQENVDRFT